MLLVFLFVSLSFFGCTLGSMWDLSSPTREGNHTLFSGIMES